MLFWLPPLAAALTLVLIVLAVWSWRARQWSVAGRLHFSLVVLAAAGFIGLLAYGRLLRV